jgi:hypothetical protein
VVWVLNFEGASNWVPNLEWHSNRVPNFEISHRRRGSGCGAGTVVAVISFCFGGEGKALVSEFFKQQISVRPTLAATPSGAASAN